MTTRQDAARWYDDFALGTGLRDWLHVNPRHERLKVLVDELVGTRRGLRILDVGCGGGVLTSHLCRFGDVLGIDFSRTAVAAARRLVPEATFRVGSVQDLAPHERFDLITAFDVLEHVPAPERPEFLAALSPHLAPDGRVFASTPFPAFTRHRRRAGDDTLQIVDEEVELPRLLAEAEAAGLQLVRFEAYDVFAGSPEYQAIVLAPEGAPGSAVRLRSAAHEARMRRVAGPRRGLVRRAVLAARAARAGRPSVARWFLTGTSPRVRS